MKTQRIGANILIVISALLLLGTAACKEKEAAPAAAPTEIVIGAVAPMTGKYAEMGKDLLAAVEMAVEERNAAGGIDGKKIRLIVEDDKASPQDAVTVAHKLVADSRIVGIVGHMNSGTMQSASPVYATAGIPVVMPVPTNPDITKQGFKNLFRVPITDEKQGPACAFFILDKLNKKKVAIVHNKQAYGEGIATEVRKALSGRGVEPVSFDGFNAEDQDFRSLITRLKRASPDVVFLGGGHSEAGLFIRQARDLGLNVPFVMGDGCFDSQLMKIAGGAAEGSYVTNIAPSSAPNSKAEAFFKKFQAKHGKIVAFAPLGYVSTNILLDAIDRAEDKTRGGVLSVLAAPDYSNDSILGSFSFEANGDSKGQKVFMHVIEGGAFKAASW